ncbi:T9SS type A sorting domain-containing protein, partial [Muribaculum caecicola]
NSFSIISRFESGVPYIESGNSETITFGGGFAGEQGKSYVARLEIYNASTRKFEPLSDFMTFTVGGTSAIYTPQADITARIYPNPAASTATITAGAKITSLKVYSVNGTLTNVEADITNNIAVIDVTPLSSGLYLLQLHTTEGTSTLKLIKH